MVATESGVPTHEVVRQKGVDLVGVLFWEISGFPVFVCVFVFFVCFFGWIEISEIGE